MSHALTLAALVRSTAAFFPAVRDVRCIATQPRFAAAPLMWEFAVPEEDKGWEHDQKRKRKPPAAAAGVSERVEPEEATVLEELNSHEIVAAGVEDEAGSGVDATALSAANEADAQVLLAEEAVERALDELAKAKEEAATLRAEADRVAARLIAMAAAHAEAAGAITVSVGDDPHPGFDEAYAAQTPEKQVNRAVPQSATSSPRGKLRVESPTVGTPHQRSRISGNSLAGRNKAAVEQAPRAAKMGAAPASEDAPLDAPLDLNTAFLQAALPHCWLSLAPSASYGDTLNRHLTRTTPSCHSSRRGEMGSDGEMGDDRRRAHAPLPLNPCRLRVSGGVPGQGRACAHAAGKASAGSARR